jgi:hypothetical protein
VREGLDREEREREKEKREMRESVLKEKREGE